MGRGFESRRAEFPVTWQRGSRYQARPLFTRTAKQYTKRRLNGRTQEGGEMLGKDIEDFIEEYALQPMVQRFELRSYCVFVFLRLLEDEHILIERIKGSKFSF